MSEWISVKDKQPEHAQPILYVVRGAFDPYVKKGERSWDGNDWWWCDEDGDFDDAGNDGDSSYVTHWMPIPDPPKV